MATQPRISRILMDDGLGNTRQWVATAAVQDTAAGGSVSIEVVHSTTGGTPPGTADGTSQLRLRTADGTVIRSFTVPLATGTNTFTFHFTDTGDTGGAARCGTVELLLDMQRTTVVTYDIESDGSPASAPAGFTLTTDRGWIRGTTTCTLALSNVSAGGAKTEPASFNESIFVRSTLGAVSYDNETLTLGVSDSAGGPAQTGTSNSATAATRDATLTGIVDNRFTAAARTFTSTVAVPNDAFSGNPWTSLTTTTADTIAGDPRITITHHLQLNNNTYSSALNRDSRLASDLGFVTWVATNARSEAINGLVATHSLGDTDNLVADAFSASETTGSTGRPASMQTWDKSLPGGSWTHVVTVTTSDASGLASPASEEWSLLAASPSLRVIVGSGPPIASRAKHMTDAETSFVSFLGAIDVDTRVTLSTTTTPAIDSAEVALFRVNASAQAQYLNASNVWTNITPGTAIDFHAAAETAAGSGVFLKTFTTTSDWGTHDIAVVGRVVIGGTPYGGVDKEIVVGSANGHDGYSLDGPGLALSGHMTFR